MFGIRWRSLALFLAGYALHIAALFALNGRLVLRLPESVLIVGALAGLLAAVAAVWIELRRLDEVQRSFALNASAVSFAGTAALAYLGGLPGMEGIVVERSLWAIALALWLVTYGALQWRAR